MRGLGALLLAVPLHPAAPDARAPSAPASVAESPLPPPKDPANAPTAAPSVAQTDVTHARTALLGLGATYDRVFAVNVYSGELSAGLGWRDDQRWGYLIVHADKGSTQHGLSTWSARAGVSLEWGVHRLHLGGEVTAGFLSIARVTKDEWMTGGCFGGEAFASFDVARLSTSDTLVVRAGFGADLYFDPVAWGPSVSLVYRWDQRAPE